MVNVLLHLWLKCITFVVVTTFVVNVITFVVSITFVVVITFVVNVITFVVNITFVGGYYICDTQVIHRPQ